MNLADHDNMAPCAMPEPSKAQQGEYYRLYAEIEASFEQQPLLRYKPSSRLIHAEVVRRMGLSQK